MLSLPRPPSLENKCVPTLHPGRLEGRIKYQLKKTQERQAAEQVEAKERTTGGRGRTEQVFRLPGKDRNEVNKDRLPG